tara:strand:- start:68 stop:796 length:729 start_codon:yes stop_codon:yes gene_type:complete
MSNTPKGTPQKRLMARAPNKDYEWLQKMHKEYGPSMITRKDVSDFHRVTRVLLTGSLTKEQRSEMQELSARMWFALDSIARTTNPSDPEAALEMEERLTRLRNDLEERQDLLEGRKPKKPPVKKIEAEKASTDDATAEGVAPEGLSSMDASDEKAPIKEMPLRNTPPTPSFAKEPISGSTPGTRSSSGNNYRARKRKEDIKGWLIGAGIVLFLVGISLGMCGYDSSNKNPWDEPPNCGYFCY